MIPTIFLYRTARYHSVCQFLTLLGLFLLGGVEVNAVNLLGLALNSLGGIYYSYIKFEESKEVKAKAAASKQPQQC